METFINNLYFKWPRLCSTELNLKLCRTGSCFYLHILFKSVFLNIRPLNTTLHGPLIGSTTGRNWQLCHHQLLPDWEARCDTTNTGERIRAGRRAFLSMQKVHTGVLPTRPSVLPLFAVSDCWSHCQTVGVWGSCEYHQMPPQVPPVVEKHCSNLFCADQILSPKPYDQFI